MPSSPIHRDAIGNLTKIDYPNTADVTFNYDSRDRLINMADGIGTIQWAYNDANYVTQEDGLWSDDVSYGYDGVDQLTSEVLSQGGTPLESKSFAYDPMGNRTATSSVTLSETISSTYTNNRLNQIVGHTSSWGGNLTRHRATGTGSATSMHTEYVYDDIDRLVAVIKKNPTTLANESKTEFVYDGFSQQDIICQR